MHSIVKYLYFFKKKILDNYFSLDVLFLFNMQFWEKELTKYNWYNSCPSLYMFSINLKA